MKRFILILSFLFLFGLGAIAQKAKVFDVRNGGTTNTTIEYLDAASKQAVIDAFCAEGSYNGVDKDGNSITKQQFFHRELTAIISEKVRRNRHRIAESQKPPVDESDLP